MRWMMPIVILVLSLLVTTAGWSAAEKCSPTTTKAEAELGAKTAERIEKDYKLVKDEVALARLNAMCVKIAPVTQRPGVVYTCKILDTGALNAMAIPGGTIYVTKGLLAAVESDHELAGVLAHEIAHNSLCHASKMIEREARTSLLQIIGVLTTVYASRGTDANAGEIIMMSEFMKQALLNGYSIDLEIEADRNGCAYLHQLPDYDPVGLYSVILGFRSMDRHRPKTELGYLKTHPYSDERVTLIEQQLTALGRKINLWNVVNFRARVIPPTEQLPGYTVRMGSVNLLTLTAADGEKDAAARAAAATEAINRRLISDYIQQFDVEAETTADRATLYLRRTPILSLVPADAQALPGATLEGLAKLVQQRMKDAIWREMVKRD